MTALAANKPRWVVAWALAVTQTVGYGVLFYTFTVVTVPMESELGLTRTQTSLAFSLGLLLSGLAAAPIGRWVDAHGARGLMSLGSALGALLVFTWSHVADLTSLMLVQAGIGVVMAAVLYDVAFTVVAKSFRRNRMRAMLIVTTVAGLASTIFVPLASWLVEAYGWRDALRVLAAVLAVTTVPLHFFALRGPRARVWSTTASKPREYALDDEEAGVDTRTALRSGSFWWVAVAFTLDRLAIVAIAAHSVPLLLERGYQPGAVAAAVGAIGLMQVAGRLLFAPAAGRQSLRRLTAVTFLVRAMAVIVLLSLDGALALWLFAACFGAANGASTLARAGLVAETFGTGNYGAINGSMSLLIATVQTVSPLAVGALRMSTGSYTVPLYLLVAVSILAALTVSRARSVTGEALPLVRL